MMSQELITQDQPQGSLAASIAGTASFQPPALPPHVNAGAVAVEQARAIADAKAKRLLAREYRRNMLQATQDVREVCRIPEFAQIAFYSVPRGNGTVTGDSIRMAEELARCWGNIEYGHRELSRSDDKSEVMVFAIDLETGLECSRQLTVPHVIDTKYGPKKCRDQKDIDDLINNKASKQRRGCILAVIPQWLREIAREECRKTLSGDNTVPITVRVRKMVDAFANYGVTVEALEAKIRHKLDAATADDIVTLTGVFNALREGDAVSDHFDLADHKSEAEASAATANKLAEAAKAGAATTTKRGAASKPPAETDSKNTKPDSKPAEAPASAEPVATEKAATEPTNQQQVQEPEAGPAEGDDLF